mmetsp:Transcript_11857/g.31305  ORF Transcript_11857/g.31305 Transcript_11857/m.31305 type:complete len:262 (-) Transcript_11857:1-786(-)
MVTSKKNTSVYMISCACDGATKDGPGEGANIIPGTGPGAGPGAGAGAGPKNIPGKGPSPWKGPSPEGCSCGWPLVWEALCCSRPATRALALHERTSRSEEPAATPSMSMSGGLMITCPFSRCSTLAKAASYLALNLRRRFTRQGSLVSSWTFVSGGGGSSPGRYTMALTLPTAAAATLGMPATPATTSVCRASTALVSPKMASLKGAASPATSTSTSTLTEPSDTVSSISYARFSGNLDAIVSLSIFLKAAIPSASAASAL